VTDANGAHVVASAGTITVTAPLGASASALPTAGDAPLAVDFFGNAGGGVPPYTFIWTFGDGAAASGLNLVHSYAAAGSYTASLNVSDSAGHRAAASTTITVQPPPAATASASVSAGDAPVTVNFTGSASGGTVPYSYAWTFGDGATASSQNPSHAYTSAGIFNAQLTVSDATGRTAIADVPTITVSPALTTTAGVSSRLGTIPFAVDFSSTPAGGLQPYAYAWTFGDGGAATTQAPTHTYTAAGTYTPEVTVTDANGVKAVASAGRITATGPLSALASALPAEGDASLNVTFWGSADGGIAPYGYSWTFGDGSTAAGQNSGHTYTAAGTYTATLTVTDASGSTASATAMVTVSPALVAAASATTAAGGAPLVVSFTGEATGGKGPFTYSWTFGDGNSSNSQNPSHTYATAGTYTATLTVTDAYLTAAAASAPPITVSPGPLVASATATRAAGASPLATTLAGSASGGVPPYSYSWDFGDGASSTLATPAHAYTGAGTYTATLTVNDGNGQSSQATVHLTVYPALGITTSESPSSGQAPLRVAFSASASGGRPPFAYSWDFGDGARASGATAAHAYGAGAFRPSLRVSDAAGDVWSGLVGTVYSASAPAPTAAPTEGPGATPSPTPSPTATPGEPSATPSPSPASTTPGGDSNSPGQGGAGGDRNTYIVLVLVTGSALLSGLGGALYLGWRRRRLL
jgi:PKD repeat protein